MCEINGQNLREKLPKLKESLKKAKFVSLDLEFSALEPLKHVRPSLFDNNEERYIKLSQNLRHVLPIQIGLTAFHFDDDSNDFFGEVYSFFICPPAFGSLDKYFYFQASSIQFLVLHRFDFNKFAYSGLSFLTKTEEAELRLKLKNNVFDDESDSILYTKIKDLIRKYGPVVNKWYNSSKEGDFLEIDDIKHYKNFYEIKYFLHKHFRTQYPNLWTYEQNNSFYIKRASISEYETLMSESTLDENLLFELKGFNHVFEYLTALKKPIVGHNFLQDLMILTNCFETPLPRSYSQFKAIAHRLFPVIFDTKTIYYELRSHMPKEKTTNRSSLEELFEHFKNGPGRHLAKNLGAMAIESDLEAKYLNKYHDAAWDSFCAGYIFIRMGYYYVSSFQPKKREFVFTEVVGQLDFLKNRVNLIKGSTNYFRIDGQDPNSTRPPWLIVESLKNEPVDVNDLTSLLSCYGCADVRKLSSNGHRVLVAMDTYRAAKDISKSFKSHQKFQVKQYSPLKHTRAGQALLLTAATISGALLLWLTHSMVKKTIR